MRFLFLCIFFVGLFTGCSSDPEEGLFVLRMDTAVQFENNLTYTEDFNPYTYRNFYNGGGVAMGDINNDGWIDLYFTGNLVDNKLFLNKGNWEFEDITDKAGVGCPEVWSSGANFVDLNGDGLLDLYVCKAGKPGGAKRYNELFINQGDLTFKEESAKYGLDIEGLSIQSAFFDYDRDGDLDCYLLNNSMRAVGGFDLIRDKRKIPTDTGNKFMENRDGRFYDVSTEAGIYTSAIGFGLGITLSDFNLDGWTDIYISNDFFEKDYLYLNNQDKTFSEKSTDYFQSLPMGSMGADVGDLDNDQKPDLMITEMLPDSLHRKKTKATYESWKKYNLAIKNGYDHQLPRNMLQRNFGKSGFMEVGRMTGVSATNWSWSCLLQDFDNDGNKDIIVANGIYKDLLDRDYLTFIANDTKIKSMIANGKNTITKLIDAMPSQAVPNYAFKNEGGFNFSDQTHAWGIDQPSFSNGSAYGDLDNDGDLDLVINNVNMPSFIYENTLLKANVNFIQIKLKGIEKNTQAIGSKVTVFACDQALMNEQFPSRGFQSSISNYINVGLGTCETIDSLIIQWPNGTRKKLVNPAINQLHQFNQDDKSLAKNEKANLETTDHNVFTKIQPLGFTHQEIKFNQFNRERLLFKMNTSQGPAIATADFNGDQQPDIFVGGAKNQHSVLYRSNGENYDSISIPFLPFVRSEVVDAVFFDSDQDGDLDLYVAHGGTAYSPRAAELEDILFLNDGRGNLEKAPNPLPFPASIATGALAIEDFDLDGLPDIFVGNRNSNNLYGKFGSGYLFKNNGNNNYELLDVPDLKDIGIITDAAWLDINGDKRADLMVVGEWMPITIFINKGNTLKKSTDSYGLADTRGMWNCLRVADFNKDGKMDIFAGNTGTNTILRPQYQLFVNDFDHNGQIEQILCERVNDKLYPVLDMDEITSQLPSLKRKFLYYRDYASASMSDLFGSEELEKSRVLALDMVETMLWKQTENGFERQSLPSEVQYSSVHTALFGDFNEDGITDILMGGNHNLVKPQFGRYDASKGWLVNGVKQEGEDNTIDFPLAQSLNVQGQIRNFVALDDKRILIGINDQPVIIVE